MGEKEEANRTGYSRYHGESTGPHPKSVFGDLRYTSIKRSNIEYMGAPIFSTT